MTSGKGLRERTRRAVRSEIMQTALGLFVEKGFDAVTVDEIAAAVGLSRRSFFRYFPSKEDVVLNNLQDGGLALAERLADRPVGEDAWSALRAAFDMIVAHNDRAPERTLRILRMLSETPALRASHLEKQSRWQELLAPHLLDRLPAGLPDELRPPAAKAVAGAALACLDTAQEVWRSSAGRASLGELLDRLMGAVHPLPEGGGLSPRSAAPPPRPPDRPR